MAPRDRIEDHHPEELDLLDYLFGHLPREASDQIRKHIGACRACQRTIGDLSVTVDELDRLPTIAIPHDSLHGHEVPRPSRRSRLVALPAIAILAAGALAMAAFGIDRGGQDVAPATTVTILSVGDLTATVRRASGAQAAEARIAFDTVSSEYVVLAPRGRLRAVVAALQELPRGAVRVDVAER